MGYSTKDIGVDQLEEQELESSFFLVGLLSAFMNRFQAFGDKIFEEISWKQCFVLICIQLFKEPPSLKELANVMGSSHQNIKQMLIKLEKSGYIEVLQDKVDKRKQRIVLTKKADEYSKQHDALSQEAMKQLYNEIDEEDIKITIKTILHMERNLEKM